MYDICSYANKKTKKPALIYQQEVEKLWCVSFLWRNERVIKFKEALIGINNRNLKTLKTDINTTFDIHDVLVDHPGPLISESGIKTKDELLELSNKTSIKTFLIGESLLKNLENNSIFSVL